MNAVVCCQDSFRLVTPVVGGGVLVEINNGDGWILHVTNPLLAAWLRRNAPCFPDMVAYSEAFVRALSTHSDAVEYNVQDSSNPIVCGFYGEVVA